MRILPFINLCFLVLIGLVLSGYFFFSPICSIESDPIPVKKKAELPPPPFKLSNESYEAIGTGPLDLNWVAPQLELPDLKEELIFYGKQGRPDFQDGKELLHIAFKRGEQSKTVPEKEKIFLTYAEGHYSFSDSETALWLELSPSQDYLKIVVSMRDENGALVKTPAPFHSFILKEEEFKLPPRHDLEVGGMRVDGGFFMRQHARLMGKDLFFDIHGGDEYAFTQERERIDFRPDENPYSCFVKEGDLLVWKEGQWKVALDNEDTVGLPLLVLKKIDDRVALFDFWEAHGQGKLPLNLIRHKVHDPFPDLTQEFRFVGAKTWAQFIVECRNKRIILRSGDWLVLESDGWRKISTAQEVDDYANQKLEGPLFVLDKMVKQDGRQTLIGHLFNSSRTEVQDIELKTFEKEKEKIEVAVP